MTDRELAVKIRVVMWKAFRTVDSLVNETFRDYDLTPTQFNVLDLLYSKGAMKIATLIDNMLATSGNMTVVIRNLEDKGLVTRHKCSQDKRAYWIALTELGHDMVERALPAHIDKIEETFSILSRKEQEELVTLLKKFKDL